MSTESIFTENAAMTAKIFGSFDENIDFIQREFGVKISVNRAENGIAVTVDGDDPEGVRGAASVIRRMKETADEEGDFSEQSVRYIVDCIKNGQEKELSDFTGDTILVNAKGGPVKAKTAGQKKYVDRIENNTITFGVGPAGTGKTFLAVAMAVKALKNDKVERIILTRPAIEAGEKLGYLPGDLQSKIDPYLRPLYDALFELIGHENYSRYTEKQTIEIAPLAYMRGRTLDDSFIIFDEAQNATPEQMKMFLTRLGFNSKAVVTGDLTQTDLPRGQTSGLSQAVRILEGTEDIAVHRFTDRDVVRHKLVQKIILAYEKYDKEQRKAINEAKEKYQKFRYSKFKEGKK